MTLSERVGELMAVRDRAGLFFDIDGVLAPIADRPELARVPECVRRALSALVGGYRMVVAVSGRSIDDAADMLGIEGLVMVGDHGGETRGARGAVRRVAPADRLVLEEASASLAADETLMRMGVRVELKRASLALHVRGAPDEPAALEAAAASAAAVGAGLGLVHHRGRAVVDLKLPGVNKGTAVAGLARECGLQAALYVGDDRTDVDAMRALRAFRRPAPPSSGVPFATFGAAVSGDSAGRPALSPLILLGVRSEEMPLELAETADLLISLEEVLPLLESLLPPIPG